MADNAYRIGGIFELERNFRELAAATAKAEARAVNRVSTSIITAQSRAIVERLSLKVSRVKEAVRIAVKATPASPRVVLEIKRRPVGLIEYAGRWRGVKSPGATAIVLKGGTRSTLTGTFIAAGKNGNRQIFERKGKGRLPIKALYGPSVFSQFKRDDIKAVGDKTWQERLPIELQRE
ncbi:MAG: phage tail protein, partial [Dokdonella sp.]